MTDVFEDKFKQNEVGAVVFEGPDRTIEIEKQVGLDRGILVDIDPPWPVFAAASKIQSHRPAPQPLSVARGESNRSEV
ncbi:MAG TPA: hypothetical protein VGN12_20075 [Pirellulales bacterium]